MGLALRLQFGHVCLLQCLIWPAKRGSMLFRHGSFGMCLPGISQ
jgi:hypothetical protein